MVKKNSMSETDDMNSVGTSRKGKGKNKLLDGAVEEKYQEDTEEQESDGDMEEAGGRDEQD